VSIFIYVYVSRILDVSIFFNTKNSRQETHEMLLCLNRKMQTTGLSPQQG